jgi:CMD domain protein
MTETTVKDVLNQLAGVAEDSSVAELRRQKPDLVTFAQGSYDALLEPDDPGSVSLFERHAIAYRIGLLTNFEHVAAWHRERLESLGTRSHTIEAIAAYPDGEALEPRIEALLAHTDRVTQAPGLSEPEHIEQLKAVGLSPTEIVTIAQLIGFLAYQVRAIAVARAFAEGRA